MWRRHGQIIMFAAIIASCARAKEPARPSFLPTLSSMTPVIGCVDNASPEDKAAIKACLQQEKIDLPHVGDPETKADFEGAVVLGWLMLDRDPKKPLTPASFQKAIDYARCIETAAYRDAAFSSRTRRGVEEARHRAELACKSHPMSIFGLDPNTGASSPDVAERLFANLIGNVAFTYALKANGWFPEEMRPCIRYLDGRPPSAGCAGKPQPPIVAPPKL